MAIDQKQGMCLLRSLFGGSRSDIQECEYESWGLADVSQFPQPSALQEEGQSQQIVTTLFSMTVLLQRGRQGEQIFANDPDPHLPSSLASIDQSEWKKLTEKICLRKLNH